jgi:hypothetical protein
VILFVDRCNSGSRFLNFNLPRFLIFCVNLILLLESFSGRFQNSREIFVLFVRAFLSFRCRVGLNSSASSSDFTDVRTFFRPCASSRGTPTHSVGKRFPTELSVRREDRLEAVEMKAEPPHVRLFPAFQHNSLARVADRGDVRDPDFEAWAPVWTAASPGLGAGG